MKTINELEQENQKLREELHNLKHTSLSEAHRAIEPYIAGGSEYTGIGGLIRAIREVGERQVSTQKRLMEVIQQRNVLEAERDYLLETTDEVNDIIHWLRGGRLRNDCVPTSDLGAELHQELTEANAAKRYITVKQPPVPFSQPQHHVIDTKLLEIVFSSVQWAKADEVEQRLNRGEYTAEQEK